jgi:methylmalonyl-CoA/ethylmalonyl-CoA epimerase
MSRARIDHIGIVVDNLEESIVMFSKLLGAGPDRRKDMPDVGLKIAEFDTANITIELLQYSGQNDAFAKQVMGGESGINHFSIAVENMADAITEMAATGAETMSGFPRDGSHGRVAFFKPETTGNILLEVCEPD